MASWKGAFVAVLMSGIVVGILLGHLAIWTGIGAALGAILADRERRRTVGSVELAKPPIGKSHNLQGSEQ